MLCCLVMRIGCRLTLRSYRLACLLAGMFVRTVGWYDDLIGISNLRQVVDVWKRMDLLQHVEYAALIFVSDFSDRAVVVGYVTENDGTCWTSLGTSGLDFVASDWAVFHFCLQFACLCALHAEGTFLHYTAAAGSNVWV